MSAKTGTTLRDAVKSNLGSRDSGKIGSIAVDTAILDSLNKALLSISLRDDTPALEANVSTYQITTAGYVYAFPTTDEDGVVISVKNFLSCSATRTAETIAYTVQRIGNKMRDRYFPYTNTSRTGRPELYSVFNKALEFWPFPDTTYNLVFRVNIWPTFFTESTMGNSHQYGAEWDYVMEFIATADCYFKLGQIDDARMWDVRAKEELEQVVGAIRSTPDWDLASEYLLSGGISSSDAQDPFVRSVR